MEEDTNHNGQTDRNTTYSKGVAVKMVHDGDGDGFKKTATLFKNGKASLQSQDTNKDG